MKNSNNEKTNFKEHFKWGFRDIFTTKGIWIFLIVTFFFTFLQPFLDYVAGGGYASEDTSIMGGIIVGAGTNANIFIVMFASLIVWKDYKTGYVYQLESVWQKLSYFITKIVFLVIFAVLT